MKTKKRSNRGGTSIMAVFFVSLFSILAVSFAGMGDLNVQMARNHRDLAEAQAAAESGLEYASYLVLSYVPPDSAYSAVNTVNAAEAENTFDFFSAHVINTLSGSPLLNGQVIDWNQALDRTRVPGSGGLKINPADAAEFSLVFQFYPGDTYNPHRIVVSSIGLSGSIERKVSLSFPIRKDSEILEYAIASRGRMWVTGDSTIHGDIFSGWDRPEISPFMTTAETRVEGTINTVLSRSDIEAPHPGYNPYQYKLETLDENGNPMYDDEGHRIVEDDDFIKGHHEGINYDQPQQDMPGMSIDDYNTDMYLSGLADIPSCPLAQREVEYFPHQADNFNLPRDGTPGATANRRLERHVYENQHFTNVRLPDNRNALFRNCTFDGILYIDCYKSGSSYYNNVRFDNCTFNGPVITDVPQVFKWMHNVLYFTGAATFQNSAMAEATILAPHFNVNLGDTNPTDGDNNVLTGAIIGGIVDVRGNAEVYGTIISMCDTTQWDSGYVSNIGATLGDGGRETSSIGDVGTIHITPDVDNMLPSGMITPIVIVRDGNTYVEY